MANVFDVAKYILEKQGSMTAMKLQKLVYYAQAWSLVWDERQLFQEQFEAWANGPVCPPLYQKHRGMFTVDASIVPEANPAALDHTARETLDAVLGFYGDKSSQWLSDLTHNERPWQEARGNTPPGMLSSNGISTATMAEYYASL